MAEVRELIPTKLSKPKKKLSDYLFLIYGVAKIGKTSLLAQMPEALFLFFEPGGKALRLRQIAVKNWRHLKNVIDALEEDKKGVKNIVIDPIDYTFRACESYILKNKFGGITDPSEAPFGKAWKAIRWEFTDQILRIANLGIGVFFISHVSEKEIEPEDEAAYSKIMPSMAKQPNEIISGMVDITGYCRYGKKGRRELIIRGSKTLEAGHRLKERFKGIEKIPMGNSAEEAYQNLLAAFENRLAETGKEG